MPDDILRKGDHLESCPFCGAKPEITKMEYVEDRYWIYCPNCGIEQHYSSDYDRALTEWNARVSALADDLRASIEDVNSYLYRERDHYSKDFDGERVRLLTGYINTMNRVLKEI